MSEERTARWYVVHTKTSYENKVKDTLEKLVENRGMQDLVLETFIPTEEQIEPNKEGKMVSKTVKLFPGYVFVKMIVTPESWYVVRNTQGVTGFLGDGTDPIPLLDEDVRKMGLEKIEIKLNVNEGDTVRIISGPFKGFVGLVEEVNADKQTLRTKVDMFGRSTPVELGFDQVDTI